MQNPLPKLRLEQFRLSNGLTVFLVPDRTVPLVAVNVNYMVGSKNERPGRTGFAHLFEHMMFQGSKHWNDNYNKPLQEVGGLVNGGTSTDRTRYWELLPSAYLERALWLESDRMGFLLDALTQERLDNQRAVVQNERRQNYENRPYGTLREKVAAALYPPGHPYSWIPIGSMADIEAATLADVREFFTTYYAPNNASLCIAGDFESDAARALVEKYFAALPPGPPVTYLGRAVPELPGEVVLVVEDRVELHRTQITWHTVPYFDPDDAALDVFARVLGGSKTSRLYKSLVHERQIAHEVSAHHASQQLGGMLQVSVTARPDKSPRDVERAADMILADLLESGITGQELERAQIGAVADAADAMQNLGGFSGISDKVNEYWQYLGEPDRFRWDLQRYLDLTPERVIETARNYLGSRRLIARVVPVSALSAAAEPAPALDRTVVPGPGPSRPFRLPEFERFTLPNGLDVMLVPQSKVPTVSLTLLLKSGAEADPPERPGLASFATNLLHEGGAAGLGPQEIAERIEAQGAQLDATAIPDVTVLSLSGLAPRLAETLGIMADLVLRPDFAQAELDRVRRRRLVSFRQLTDTPEFLAGLGLVRTFFGDHPYGHLALGTPSGVESMTREDVVAHWMRHFVPGNATLLVAGDATRASLESKLANAFGGWTAFEPARAVVPPPVPSDGARVVLVDKPGAPQSFIVAALPGPPRATADFARLELLNAAFGGQFTSRLNLNLRETRGYTYGIRSRFEHRRDTGFFAVQTQVQTAVTAPSVAEIVHELRRVSGHEPLTAPEIEFARGAILDGYARRFETAGKMAKELFEPLLYGLPPSVIETFPDEVRAATADELAALAARWLDPQRVLFVIAGDVAAIRPALEALRLGPVTVLEDVP